MSGDGAGQRAPKSAALLVLVLAVDLAAIAVILTAPAAVGPTDFIAAAALVLLAGFTGGRTVRIARLRTEVTVTDAFTFCALATAGPWVAAIVAASSVVGAAIGRARWPKALRLVFNLGNVVLSTGLGWWAFVAVGGRPGLATSEVLEPLAAATIVYFLVNTGLVTLAIALERGQPMFATWRRSALWTASSTLTGLTLCAGLLLVVGGPGPWALVIGVPPCWMIAAFYRAHKERVEAQARRIEEVEELNAVLESRVAERTEALEQAAAQMAVTNEELRHTNERLNEASEAKSQFLAKMTHELRTPLNAVIGFSEMLLTPAYGETTEPQREFIRDIKCSGEHLLHLINNILDLSKIDAGHMEVRREAIELPKVLDEVLSMVYPQATRKGLELTKTCAPEIDVADLDPGMLREILVNLLSNAVKFTSVGGVELTATRSGADLFLEVADSGIGIPEDQLERIFEDFYQVGASYSREYQGTGLGLALVRQLVELHGGAIEVLSKVGDGTRISCRLPACLREEVAQASPTEVALDVAAPAVGERLCVLVVDDEPFQRKLMRNVLRAGDFEVRVAETIEAAQALLDEAPPHVVLTAVSESEPDGLELIRRIKQGPMTAAVTVVAVTAQDGEGLEESARVAGCDGWIRKPIRLHELASQVRGFCDSRHAASVA